MSAARAGMSRAKQVRVLLLLLVLLFVALDAWLTRSRTTSWDRTLWVRVYPIAGDDSPNTRRYVESLEPAAFEPIEAFMRREGGRYGVALKQPVHVELGRVLGELPPLPPPDRAPLAVALWSLKLRWWARGIDSDEPGPRCDARLFAIYYDPELNPRVSHSLGLQKGLVGIVHAFASARMTGSNNVVIAHEMLHTLGATDKYDPANGLPLYPLGYAEPERQPALPQRYAEIMGGRIPVTPGRAEIPESLGVVRIGPGTALEIGFEQPR